MNCRYEFSNPEDMLWGSVRNGKSNGLFKDIVDERIHFTIGAVIGLVQRHRVSSFSPNIGAGEAGLSFASPLPSSR